MQSDDIRRSGGVDPMDDQSPGWSVEDFDDFEPFESPAGGESPEGAQGILQFPAGSEAISGGVPEGDLPNVEPVAVDLSDDMFETDFVAGAGAPARSENDDAVEVPEFASFTADSADEELGGEFHFEAASPSAAAVDEPIDDEASDDDEHDFDTLTSDRYLQATTREFADLAEEIARTAETEHVPSAVAATMPGLETGVVGLDDVVVATGEDPSVITPRRGSDLALRILTGAGLAAIFFASLYAPLLVGLFVFLVLMTAAVEYFSTVIRAGYRPVGLFGLLGTAGALLGTWVWGPQAIPVALAATFVVTLIFFGISGGKRATLRNAGLTVLGTAWIGGLGGFIFDMVEAEHYGWLIVATIVTVALMDMAQYFFGRRLGRLRLAPRVSPNKTVEGLIGGMIVALVIGIVFGLLHDPVLFLDLESPIDLGVGLAIGLVVAGSAPFGDLAASALKRSIGAKDMGTVLPGHGGLFDRIDAMLFAIPLTWIVFAWTGLLA